MVQQALLRLQSGRVVAAAVCFTFLVTFMSLRELHGLIGTAESSSAGGGGFLQNTDWRAVAERAVEHVEHLPHLPKQHPLYSTYQATGGEFCLAGVGWGEGGGLWRGCVVVGEMWGEGDVCGV